jgi:hypothetical protein
MLYLLCSLNFFLASFEKYVRFEHTACMDFVFMYSVNYKAKIKYI